MEITVEILIAIFTVLATISLAAERLIEMLKPLIEKIPTGAWQASAKIALAILSGFGLSALFRFDLLAQMGVHNDSVLIGYALSGLIASTGSTVINRILEWLKTLKSNTTTSVTTKTSQGSGANTTILEETVTAKTTAPVVEK